MLLFTAISSPHSLLQAQCDPPLPASALAMASESLADSGLKPWCGKTSRNPTWAHASKAKHHPPVRQIEQNLTRCVKQRVPVLGLTLSHFPGACVTVPSVVRSHEFVTCPRRAPELLMVSIPAFLMLLLLQPLAAQCFGEVVFLSWLPKQSSTC